MGWCLWIHHGGRYIFLWLTATLPFSPLTPTPLHLLEVLYQLFPVTHSFNIYLLNGYIYAKYCWSHWWYISDQKRHSIGIFILSSFTCWPPHLCLVSTLTLYFSSHPNVLKELFTLTASTHLPFTPQPIAVCIHTHSSSSPLSLWSPMISLISKPNRLIS